MAWFLPHFAVASAYLGETLGIDDALIDHGRLPGPQRSALFASTLDATIMPTARQLLRKSFGGPSDG